MTITDAKPAAIGQRDRSPSFPFIPLKTAVERLTAFEEHHKRSPVPSDRVGPAWGMKPKTSQAAQTLAALKAYGLLETHRGDGGRAIVVSDDGRTYLRAQQDSIKQEVLRRSALRPKQIETYWRDWKDDRPADAACLDALVLRGGFSQDGAEKFLRVYDATIDYAGLSGSDKIPAAADNPQIGGGDEDADELPPPPTVRVGDYVQWTSGGADQFRVPRKVVGILPDGQHVQVFGSSTGIPMDELAVVDAPEATLAVAAPAVDVSGTGAGVDNDFTVLQRGNRLQITADVDLDGIATLKAILDDYESILRRLAGRKSN